MAIAKASSKMMLRPNPVFDFTKVSTKITRLLELLNKKILNTDKPVVVCWHGGASFACHAGEECVVDRESAR